MAFTVTTLPLLIRLPPRVETIVEELEFCDRIISLLILKIVLYVNWICLDYWQSVSGGELDYLLPVGINTQVQLITPDNVLTNHYISVDIV
jgi:hypothetical protein